MKEDSATLPDCADAFCTNVLPLLALGDLASVSCSCRALRDLTYGQDAVWRQLAGNYLPCNHPSLATLNRRQVQLVMQRRAYAKNSILSGRISRSVQTTITVCEPEGSVMDLLWSPCGRYLAVLSWIQISVFTVRDCMPLWRRKRVNIEAEYRELAGCKDCAFSGWNFGPEGITGFGATYGALGEVVCSLHLITLSARTGALEKGNVVDVGALKLSHEYSNVEVAQGAVSQDGKLLATPILSTACLKVPQFVLLVIALDTSTVQLVIDSKWDFRGSIEHPVWSSDASMVAVYGTLIHLPDRSTSQLVAADSVHLSDKAFDRTGALLGFSFIEAGSTSAAFFGTGTGQMLDFRINDHSFVEFATAQDCALVMHESRLSAQMWNVAEQELMHTIIFASELHDPHLTLDDRFVLGKHSSSNALSVFHIPALKHHDGLAKMHISNGQTCFYDMRTGAAAALYLNDVVWSRMSPDKCVIAAISTCFASDELEEELDHVSLVRLA